jgi:hypothetical protein
VKKLVLFLTFVVALILGSVLGAAVSVLQLDQDPLVKRTVYATSLAIHDDAIRHGVARRASDRRVFWILPDGSESEAMPVTGLTGMTQ